MSDSPRVTIAVISCNEREWLGNCLESLVAADYPDFNIIVIDNASTDGSPSFVKENFDRIELIGNKRNIGFARALNMAIDAAMGKGSEYAVFLNPDIKVTRDWLKELVKVAEKDKDTALLMPLHYDYSGDEVDQNISAILSGNPRYLEDKKRGDLKDSYEVSAAIGGCMMMRTGIVKRIGRIDNIYFLYAEDSDFSRRVIFHGYKIAVAIKSRIMHWHRMLHKDKMSKDRNFLLYRNRFIYFLKDPNKPFLHNLYFYYFNKGSGAWKMIGSWAPLTNPRYLIMALYVQFWIFLHLPVIFIKHFKDRRKT